MTLIRLLANLGYGSRREVERSIRAGRVSDAAGLRLDSGSKVGHADLRFDGQPLDPVAPLLILMHKPAGYTCSREDPGRIVFELLPERFALRNPPLSTVGRLDKETTGLLLLTDDGALLHRLIHPKSGIPKTYLATLDRPLGGDEAGIFASGTLVLRGDTQPLRPADLTPLDAKSARVVLREGRYHQVRRMFAACGNHVTALHRTTVGPLELPPDLAPGEWRLATMDERAAISTRDACR